MPLAQAHPFEPMPITHEEEMQEVSEGEPKGGRTAIKICRISSSRAVTSVAFPHVSQLKEVRMSGLASCMDRGTS